MKRLALVVLMATGSPEVYAEEVSGVAEAMQQILGILLCAASKEGKTASMQVLLERGANVNARCGDASITPLHLAAGVGDEDAVALLLSRKADVNAKDADGDAVIDYAIAPSGSEANGGKHTRVVRQVLVAQADPNSATASGRHPLIMAASLCKDDIVALLLEYKANPQRTMNGKTPLQVAREECSAKDVQKMEAVFAKHANRGWFGS